MRQKSEENSTDGRESPHEAQPVWENNNLGFVEAVRKLLNHSVLGIGISSVPWSGHVRCYYKEAAQAVDISCSKLS